MNVLRHLAATWSAGARGGTCAVRGDRDVLGAEPRERGHVRRRLGRRADAHAAAIGLNRAGGVEVVELERHEAVAGRQLFADAWRKLGRIATRRPAREQLTAGLNTEQFVRMLTI